MPVIFAELAATYRPREVSDPAKAAAAANGQYLLIRRAVYEEVGGHGAIAGDLLEDVALARMVKQAGHVLRFRLGVGRVRTRMYRGLQEMQQGWTRNLVLLFPNARRLAARRMAEFVLLAVLPLTAIAALTVGSRRISAALLLAGIVLWINFVARVRRAHFGALSTVLAVFGLPMFALLLARSEEAHRKGCVVWKGREYPGLSASRTEAQRCPKESIAASWPLRPQSPSHSGDGDKLPSQSHSRKL